MPTELFVLAALPWLAVFVSQILHRPFVVLLVWLFIAPIVTSTVQRSSDEAVLFQTQERLDGRVANITVANLVKPMRTVLVIFGLIFLLNATIRKTLRVPFDKTEIRMCIFSVILLGNALLRSWRLAFGLHTAVDAFIIPFLAYFLTRRLVTNEARFNQFLWMLGYMGCYVSGMALIERLSYSNLTYRVRGPFETRDVLSVVMQVVFFAMLSVRTSYGGNTIQLLSAVVRRVVIITAPAIVVLTITRGNWIGLLAALFVFLFLARTLIPRSRQLAGTGLSLIVFPVAIFAILLFVPSGFLETRVADSDNVYGRFATWLTALTAFGEAPIFGIGLNNLYFSLRHSRGLVTVGGVANLHTAHNSYLALLIEVGFVGFASYLAVVVSILRLGLSLYKSNNHQAAWGGVTIIAVITAYHIPALFSGTHYITAIHHIYVYALIGAIAGRYNGARFPLRIYRTRSKRESHSETEKVVSQI